METKYMKRAIELAKKGEGFTRPNPLVGAVIVKENKVIGEGYHEYFGGPHAEINAINNSLGHLKGSTIYVTLEPCSHFGKTPPCVNAIIENKISKVVIGMEDPNPLVAGNGIKILKENGIEVVTGILNSDVKELNEIFIKFITTKTPFCILKTAMTLDGKISTYTGDSKWITNEKSREHVHRIRQKVSSILVGINTVIQDNPKLNVRLDNQKNNDPERIIVDTTARIPIESNVLNIMSNAKTIIATTEKADKEHIKKIKEKGAKVIITPIRNNRVDLKHLLKELGKKGIDSALIEGGATINYNFLEQKLIDKVMFFIAPKIIGGDKAKTPVGGQGIKYMKDSIKLDKIKTHHFGDDFLIEGYLGKEETNVYRNN